ncbi:MAG: CapA family protein [Chloroflexi bacterium]|nr:CapA family protein [Chloroflexota bacterium]
MTGWINKNNGMVSLLACGDNNLQMRSDPASAYALVSEDLKEADVLFGDNEMCLYEPSSGIVGKPGWTQSEERMVEGLVSAGFTVVSCANNVNYGTEAILSSKRVLSEHGILNTGTGINLPEARKPAITEVRGVRIGFIARTAVFFPHGHAAGPDEPGVASIKCHTAYEPNPRSHELPGAPPIVRSWPSRDALEELAADVRSLRDQVDVLVTYFHWGVSGEERIAEYQQLIGHEMIEQGADLVLGSHAHCPQAVEVYNGKPIFYGMGNFAFDWDRMARWRSGLLVHCGIENKKISSVSFKPVWRREDELNQPEVVSLDHVQGHRIVDRVIELSLELGTTLKCVGNEVVVQS